MTSRQDAGRIADDIRAGRTSLGIELGSTRIKACLIGEDAEVLATGSSSWENRLEDGVWTYAIDEVWAGLQSSYAALIDDAEQRHGIRPDSFGAIGISAMMHGHLAFDAAGELLVPFRTWRNTGTGVAAAEQASVSLTSIGAAVERIVDVNVQIASAAEQQAAVSEDINRNTTGIRASTLQVLTGIESDAGTAERLAGLSQDLRGIVSRFRLSA